MPEDTDINRFVIELPELPSIPKADLPERIIAAVATELQINRNQISVRNAADPAATPLFEDLKADLEHRRRQAADELFERHDFGAPVKTAGVWRKSADGNEWSRSVKLAVKGKGAPVWFSVRFPPYGAEAIAAWDNLGHGTALNAGP
jgi:hypothetical protein